jgi:hypothetical protein
VSEEGVVFDTSALVEYARNDLRSLPVDELLREMREDSGWPVIIPLLALVDAQAVLGDDLPALERLESFATAHGFRLADAEMLRAVDLIADQAKVTPGLAQAMLLTAAGRKRQLATYAAPTLEQAGYEMSRVLDLDEMFRE